MVSGNFKSFFFTCMIIMGNLIYAQEKNKISDFLYQQLDSFLESPTQLRAAQLNEIIISKEKLLLTKHDKLAWVIIHCNLGFYENQFGNKESAIFHYEKAWKTYSDYQLKDYDIIKNCLQPLGNLYIQIGDLLRAEHMITNYLYLSEQSKNASNTIAALTNLSIVYNNQGNSIKAIEILKKGEALDPKNNNILTNLATNYLDIDSLKLAENYAKKAISQSDIPINAFQVLAAISLKKHDLKKTQSYIQKATNIAIKNSKTSARDLAKLYLGHINILLSSYQYSDILLQLKEIYTLLLPQYNLKKTLPDKEILIADRVLLQALDVHAFIYEKLNEPETALQAYSLAFEVNSKLNTIYPLLETKTIQHNQNRTRVASYLKLLHMLYNKTKNEKYILLAFKAAEQSKAPFVNEALVSKQQLIAYKNDSLVIKTKQLTYELANLETSIWKEKQKENTANIALIQNWNTTYSSKSITLNEITKKLKQKYPILLQVNKDIPIKELQKKLRFDDTTLLSYFYGTTTAFQFEITHKKIVLKQISGFENFKSIIRNYISYFNNASSINNDIQRFIRTSLKTFKALKIPTNRKKILIIPDGLLNFIPFEALLTEETKSINFQSMPFLLKSSEINYEISVNKYLRSKTTEKEKKTIFGVFPIFENTSLELPNSKKEKKYIQQHFRGVYLEGKKATYTEFLSIPKTQNILHLSTHADAGDFSKPASIKFRDQDIIINQLRGLQLQSDLVVLSACETGIGKLAKGEGPLSISRAFQYAGIKNTLFSLWKVNDKSTFHLMKNFYQNLKVSGSSSCSLRKAKLDYLNTKTISNVQKSPYYWAAFVYYGDIHPISSRQYFWMLPLGAFLLFIVFLLAIRQKKQ